MNHSPEACATCPEYIGNDLEAPLMLNTLRGVMHLCKLSAVCMYIVIATSKKQSAQPA